MTPLAATGLDERDPVLFGSDPAPGLVALEHARGDNQDSMRLFFRTAAGVVERVEVFEPFMWADVDVMNDCPVEFRAMPLRGPGRLKVRAHFKTWKDCLKAREWVSKKTGASPSAPQAPFLCPADPVQQYLLASGRTLFKGMEFEKLHRMQLDIECFTAEGYDFCNAARDSDRIIVIALGDSTGWSRILSGASMDEKQMLEEFVACVRERDPDVIEGHNLFNFDMAYIRQRAKLHGVKLALGRDGSIPQVRPSRFNVADRTVSYDRCDIDGRHVVDTYFLVQFYDVSHRSLQSFGLKDVAVHFGIAPKNRTYIDGSQIGAEFMKDPAHVLRYVADDIHETRELSALLSRSSFAQTQMIPFSYQNVCVRGNATKIDALLLREYFRSGQALPMPDDPHDFEGGYTDLFVTGVVRNVHHCDIRSLYPSLMLARRLAPKTDERGVFLRLLATLKDFRVRAREQEKQATTEAQRHHFGTLQSTFKILINSFYGYLGFSQGRFCDFAAAARITSDGRALLRDMIVWLRSQGATPVEIDTDGIYFVPPAGVEGSRLTMFQQAFAESLPEGIDIEFDGEYVSMFSYKMKNYALLSADGRMVVKGAALKSRGLEPFQREFMREVLRMKLEGEEAGIPALKQRWEADIRGRRLPIDKLAKTETLQDAPSSYAAGKSSRGRSAAYELALKADRPFRSGDVISYYVTGEKKSVQVYQAAKRVAAWNPDARDENVPYYLAKLDALYEKFAGNSAQGELDFGGGTDE